jgi:hypothetical protein
MEYLTGQKRHSSASSTATATSSKGEEEIYTNKRYKPSPAGSEDGHPKFIPEVYKKEMYTRRIPTEPPDPDFPASEIPSDTKAALLHIRQKFPTDYFNKNLPPVMLQSQLSSIIESKSALESQLRKLAEDGEILIFSNALSGGNSNFIVFYQDFANIQAEGIYHRFVTQVLGKNNQPGMIRWISKEDLMKKWKFRESEVRQLVNSGYLAIHEVGLYTLSLPGAGQFVKAYNQGDKSIRSAIKRAKYQEVLQNVSFW